MKTPRYEYACNIYPSSKSWSNSRVLSLLLNCVRNALKIHTQCPKYSIKPQQKPTTICLIISTNTPHTLITPPCLLLCRSEGKKQQNQKVELVQIGLRIVNNGWATANQSWMARSSSRAPLFSRSNRHNAPGTVVVYMEK